MPDRILFGGGFDPVHLGHLALAEFVREECDAAQLIFLPAGRSPFKGSHSATFDERLELLRLALADTDFRLDEREGRREGPSWTIDTLRELEAEEPGNLGLLIGEDNLPEFRRWREWKEILELAELIVINRPGDAGASAADSGEPELPRRDLVWPGMELSSTWLRERIAAGCSCRHLLPSGVWERIRQRGLYGATREAG